MPHQQQALRQQGKINETLYATIAGIKDADVIVVSYSGTTSETLKSLLIVSNDPNAHYHNYEKKVTKEATCKEEGEITYTCIATNEDCDKKTYTEVIPKLAHTYGEWEVVKEATTTDTGLNSHKCKVCGYEETQVIPVKGQEPEEPDTPENPDTPDVSAGTITEVIKNNNLGYSVNKNSSGTQMAAEQLMCLIWKQS